MRTIIILISILFFASCTCNKTAEISEKDLEMDHFYCTNDLTPFNGTCKILLEDSKTVKLESSYKKGILNGQTTLYYEDGTPYRKGNYVSGEHDGLWEGWFKDGKKEFEANYKSGKLDGEYIAYHVNGTIKEKGKYTEDYRVNEWVSFDENGKEISRKTY